MTERLNTATILTVSRAGQGGHRVPTPKTANEEKTMESCGNCVFFEEANQEGNADYCGLFEEPAAFKDGEAPGCFSANPDATLITSLQLSADEDDLVHTAPIRRDLPVWRPPLSTRLAWWLEDALLRFSRRRHPDFSRRTCPLKGEAPWDAWTKLMPNRRSGTTNKSAGSLSKKHRKASAFSGCAGIPAQTPSSGSKRFKAVQIGSLQETAANRGRPN
jgi:hypothetical protein